MVASASISLLIVKTWVRVIKKKTKSEYSKKKCPRSDIDRGIISTRDQNIVGLGYFG